MAFPSPLSLFICLFCIGLVHSIYYFASIPLSIASFIIGFQIIVWIPSAIKQTEKYYDLTGATTYFISTLYSLYLVLSNNNNNNTNDYYFYLILHSSTIFLWCIRLGSFLYNRIESHNGIDSRFHSVRSNPFRFLVYWSIQGVWIAIVSLPVLLVHHQSATKLFNSAADDNNNNNFNAGLFWCGWCLWAIGFIVEIISDQQKSLFRQHPENKDKFINTGLWRYSRHPNYFGEILLWFGVFLSSIGFLPSVTAIIFSSLSPLFIAYLLIFVSGIPILEKQGKKRWGEDPNYKKYIQSTSVLIPLPPKV